MVPIVNAIIPKSNVSRRYNIQKTPSIIVCCQVVSVTDLQLSNQSLQSVVSTSSITSVKQQCADDVYLQMEHKQTENGTNKMCVKTAINARLKFNHAIIARLTRSKKLIARQLL